MTDELRNRLRRLDPMPPDVRTDPVTSPSSIALLEEIMSTPVIERPTARSAHRPGRSRRPWAIGGAAAAAVAIAGGTAALLGGGGSQVADAPPLQLSLGESDPALQSCLAFSTEILADMPVAFEGTVTTVEGELVTLDVDEWFVGGEAAQVQLEAPAGMEALIGGIGFEAGQQYLVTATEGVVNYCGYTAPSTPELRDSFEQAFPG